MAIIVRCPLCENIKLTADELDAIDAGEIVAPQIDFEDAEEYAKHIVELHKSDLRISWAENFLANLGLKREAEKQQDKIVNPKIEVPPEPVIKHKRLSRLKRLFRRK